MKNCRTGEIIFEDAYKVAGYSNKQEFFIQRSKIRNEVSRPELHVDVLTIAERLKCSKTDDSCYCSIRSQNELKKGNCL